MKIIDFCPIQIQWRGGISLLKLQMLARGDGGVGGGAPPLRTSTKKEERGSKKGPFCANVLTK